VPPPPPPLALNTLQYTCSCPTEKKEIIIVPTGRSWGHDNWGHKDDNWGKDEKWGGKEEKWGGKEEKWGGKEEKWGGKEEKWGGKVGETFKFGGEHKDGLFGDNQKDGGFGGWAAKP
jgi:hypothetical protein